MKVSKISFNGTPDEFTTVAHLFTDADDSEHGVESMNGGPQSSPPLLDQLHNTIRRVLKRIPITPGQQALYEALYKAGSKGLTQHELAAAMGRTEQELSGVLGALGRRINGTEGVSLKPGDLAISVFFDVEWTDSVWHYTMRPALREVLDDEGLIQVIG